jgi:hypothetical protein
VIHRLQRDSGTHCRRLHDFRELSHPCFGLGGADIHVSLCPLKNTSLLSAPWRARCGFDRGSMYVCEVASSEPGCTASKEMPGFWLLPIRMRTETKGEEGAGKGVQGIFADLPVLPLSYSKDGGQGRALKELPRRSIGLFRALITCTSDYLQNVGAVNIRGNTCKTCETRVSESGWRFSGSRGAL